jgi:hypothetical protein
MIIAVSKIPIGIKQILQNSNRINHLAKRVLLDVENHGSVDVYQHHSKYAVILFYYAVEELGKALKLQDEMEIAKTQKKSYVTVTWFKDHDTKLARAQKQFPELRIPNYIEEKIDARTRRYHKDEGTDIIKGFTDRSDFFLISYDEDKKEWINDLASHIEQDEVILRLNKHKEILDCWLDKLEESYEKSIREFKDNINRKP